MREALASDTRTARAKGVPETMVVLRHGLRTALIRSSRCWRSTPQLSHREPSTESIRLARQES
jgi:hypothetical protein